MESVDTFTLTKTILLWKELSLCVRKLIWLNWKIECRKLILLIFVHEREPIQKWKFYKVTNLTVFALLIKDVLMGCKDTILPDQLLKNHNVICLTFERSTRQPYNDNFCLFRALALHLHGNENWRRRLRKYPKFSSITVRKETSQISKVFIWVIFQKLKTCCNSISSFMKLIL